MIVNVSNLLIKRLYKLSHDLDIPHSRYDDDLFDYMRYRGHSRNLSIELRDIQKFLLKMENKISENSQNVTHDELSDQDFVSLTCEVEHDAIPLYKDLISVCSYRYIIDPSKIPMLLRFIPIGKDALGVDVENHNFGYHFHYSRKKSGSVRRTNLLLTFDPKITKEDSELIGELHGEGHTESICVPAIGVNKRLPIYLACNKLANKRGKINFKRPGQNSFTFYEMI